MGFSFEHGQAFFESRKAHTSPCVATHKHTPGFIGTHTRVHTRVHTHCPSTYVCLDSAWMVAVKSVSQVSPRRIQEEKRYSTARIRLRDMKQTKKFPKPNRDKKLINVSVPLVIKQECTHKYSQNSKVRPR